MPPSGWIRSRLDSFCFDHPDTWAVESRDQDEGDSVYLQSDGVSFAIVGVYPQDEDPQAIVEQVVDSLRAEHPGLELEAIENEDAKFPDASAFEGLFMTLDTVAYCWVRSWRIAGRSALVFIQSVEKESADSEEVFIGICHSFQSLQPPQIRKAIPEND